VQEKIGAKNDEIRSLCGSKRSYNTFKNILNGIVADNPKFAKKSKIEDAELNNFVNKLKSLGYSAPSDLFTRKLAEREFVAIISKWCLLSEQEQESNLRHVKDASDVGTTRGTFGLPDFDRLSGFWTPEAVQLELRVSSWLTGRRDTNGSIFSVFGASGIGKTALLSTVLRNRYATVDTCWIDCTIIFSHEYLIESLVQYMRTKTSGGAGSNNLINAPVEMQVIELCNYIRNTDNFLIVLDSFESLYVDPGTLRERPRDQSIIQLLVEVIECCPLGAILLSQSIVAFPIELSWLTLQQPLWDAGDASTSDIDLLSLSRHESLLEAIASERPPISPDDSFRVDDIVDRLIDTLSKNELELLQFFVLAGEEVRLGTLKWYISRFLNYDGILKILSLIPL
jgi:hypothetical protein